LWRFEIVVFFRFRFLSSSHEEYLLLFFFRFLGQRIFFPLAAMTSTF